MSSRLSLTSTPSSSSLPFIGDDESRLLSESLPLADACDVSSYSQNTGPGGTDLSLSELSLADRPPIHDVPRFSLLAPQPAPSHTLSPDQNDISAEDEGADASINAEEDATNTTILAHGVVGKAREEKLQHDLFILKKLNAAFATFNGALSGAQCVTEHVAQQLEQTDALLDKYANMLAKAEGVTRLIFDERWQGAEADEETVARERTEALERARLEREEAARREAEECARREAEEAAQREAEERAQQEAAAASISIKSASRGRGSVANSNVRGGRGIRASATTGIATRGGAGRGISRGTGVAGGARMRSTSATGSVSTVGTGGGITRPSSAASRGAGGSGPPKGTMRRG